MANRCTKRARLDAPPKSPTAQLTKTCRGGDDIEDVITLRTELESAKKSIEQLRREKDYEVRRVRDEEQSRANVAAKDLTARLHAERHRELEQLKETLKVRFDAEAVRVAKQYEQKMKRLRSDLDRCQNELREEIEKRGLSSSARASFDSERSRLLQEIRDLGSTKRRLEEALQSAAETDRQKTAEMRRVEDACKQEVARVSKEANAEIRKLLEDLKARDHQLALLDRSQYPDKGAGLHGKQHQTDKQTESTLTKPTKSATSSTDRVAKKAELQAEVIAGLRAEVEKLTGQLAASEADRSSMKVRLGELRRELVQRGEAIANLQLTNQQRKENSDDATESRPTTGAKCQQKAVRFLLPGSTLPVLARDDTDQCDEEVNSISSELSDVPSVSSSSSSILSPDTTTFFDGSLAKNYHQLLTEHLALQRSVALLLSSCTTLPVLPTTSSSSSSSSAAAGDVDVAAKDVQPKCSEDCVSEKESLKATIETLKDKLCRCEKAEYQLRRQLEEEQEQNEELEFRLLELEESAEKCKSLHGGNAADDLLERNQSLEMQMSTLRKRLTEYEQIETDITGGVLGLPEYFASLQHQHSEMERQLNLYKVDIIQLKERLEISGRGVEPTDDMGNKTVYTATDNLETMLDETQQRLEIGTNDSVETVSAAVAVMQQTELSDDKTHCWLASNFDEDDSLVADDDKFCVMTCSISSTTSGFDDNSCASSVADMRLDEMPCEETWGFDVDEYNDLNAVEEIHPSESCVLTSSASPTGSNCENIVSNIDETCANDSSSKTSQPTASGSISEEQLRQTERLWLRQMEKLEGKLMRALESEQRATDQLALLKEEKDRRITALEEQVDLLEANEFQLSKTIHTLEQLEKAFSAHLLSFTVGGESGAVNIEQSEKFENLASVDTDEKQLELDRLHEEDSEKVKRRPCNIELCFQCKTCAVLRSTIERLQSAQKDHAVLDEKIKELDLSQADELLLHDDTVHEVVDFEAEYRELETLFNELKKVLVLERDNYWHDTGDDEPNHQNVHQPTWMTPALLVDPRCGEDYSCSMPASPVYEIPVHAPSSTVSVLSERNRELELTEKFLCQQICDLEKERQHLHELVSCSETTVHDLDIKIVELQASERTLKEDISRLRAKEIWMNARIDDLMELVGRLEDAVKGHLSTESELKLRLERHQTKEADLSRELDNTVEELRSSESKYRRWISQLEDERVELLAQVSDLSERNGDLESREAALVCKIRKMEAVESGLRNDLTQVERALNSERGEICEESLLRQVDSEEAGLVTSDGETVEQVRKLKQMVSCLKDSLDHNQRSTIALESKLKEHLVSENLLRETVAEYEKIDRLWQEKVLALEANKKTQTEKISNLESQLEAVKQRYGVQEFGFTSGWDKKPRQSESSVDKGYEFNYEEMASAIKDIIMLNNFSNNVDDEELIYWAAVESMLSDDVIDSYLMSPQWTEVETQMRQIHAVAAKVEELPVTRLSLTSTAPPSIQPAVRRLTVISANSDFPQPTSPRTSSEPTFESLPPQLSLAPPPPQTAECQRQDKSNLGVSSSSADTLDSASKLGGKTKPKDQVDGADDGELSSDTKVFVTKLTAGSVQQPRSKSADIFRSESPARQEPIRATSEIRDEVKDCSTRRLNVSADSLPTESPKEKETDHSQSKRTKSLVEVKLSLEDKPLARRSLQEGHTGLRKTTGDDEELTKDDPNEELLTSVAQISLKNFKERSSNVRQFWSKRTSETVSEEKGSNTSQEFSEHSTSNRPSMIPRSLLLQTSSTNVDTSVKSPVGLQLPVIKSVHHGTDQRLTKSHLPRPIGMLSPVDDKTGTVSTEIQECPDHQQTSKSSYLAASFSAQNNSELESSFAGNQKPVAGSASSPDSSVPGSRD